MAKKYVSMWIEEEANLHLRMLAAINGKSRSEIVRAAVQEYLLRNGTAVPANNLGRETAGTAAHPSIPVERSGGIF